MLSPLSSKKAIKSNFVEQFDNSLPVNFIALEEDFYLRHEVGMKFPLKINDSITRKAIK